jgi:thiol-disulfide isomerase/thioredoxin
VATLIVALAVSSAHSQTIQKWITPDGKTHFADHPPPGGTRVGDTESMGTSGGGEVSTKAAEEDHRAAKRAVEIQGSSGPYFSGSWYEDAAGYQEALRQQKLFHAPLLVYFRTDWCPHCRHFDGLLEDSPVRSRLAEIIKVRINPEHGNAENALFKDGYGGSGFPTIYLVSAANGGRTRISNRGPSQAFLTQFPR